jgi:hypothetical protein
VGGEQLLFPLLGSITGFRLGNIPVSASKCNTYMRKGTTITGFTSDAFLTLQDRILRDFYVFDVLYFGEISTVATVAISRPKMLPVSQGVDDNDTNPSSLTSFHSSTIFPLRFANVMADLWSPHQTASFI